MEWIIKSLRFHNEVLICCILYEVYNEYRIHLTSKITQLFPRQTVSVEVRFMRKFAEVK